MQIIKSIQSKIYEVRGERVMLDFDLASLYEVETRVLIRLLSVTYNVSLKILCFSLLNKNLKI